MRETVGRRDLLICLQLIGELTHGVVGLQRRHRRRRTRMRQVIERRKRRAVGKSRGGGDNRRVSAGAARGDPEHSSSRATQLLAQNGEFSLGNGSEQRPGHLSRLPMSS